MTRTFVRRLCGSGLLLAYALVTPGIGSAAAVRAPQSGARSAATPATAAKAAAKAWPKTRPEATGFAETSRYDDVMAFMKAMAGASPQIHLTTYGYTFEGRPMPLAVVGAPDGTPESVLATKKIRIYIQANIHAGEVEGKEALLWMLRSIAKGERAEWFKSVVLLINPIYNADGNERVTVANRGSQNGPIGGMGQRANAQNLDLNRDCVKLESAEARSLARLLTRYDPHMAIDLHTTDGTPDSGFYLTYETSLSPNDSKATVGLLRDTLLPQVTRTIKAKHGWDYFYYGGVMRGSAERAWASDEDLAKPRYTSTYFGVRNRLGILVETYSYASFEDRIKANYWFLEEVIDFVVKNGEVVRKAVATADGESIVGKQLAVREKLVKSPAPVQVVFADTLTERNPYVADRPIRRMVPGTQRTESMGHYATTEPTETSVVPAAYIVPAVSLAPVPSGSPFGPSLSPAARSFNAVIDRLEAHGVQYVRTTRPLAVKGERFRIESNTLAAREYQGTHKMRTLTGTWDASEQSVPVGSIVVPMDQPLARLAFLLFDARSDDGLMAWNILDGLMGEKPEFYPVLRTMGKVQ
ncbi:MAG TPA: M14 family metallopeptidase [Vicinamibacterales bacterium]|jgi:hypothetical protein